MFNLYLFLTLTTLTFSKSHILIPDEGFTLDPSQNCLSLTNKNCSICIDSILNQNKKCVPLTKKIPNCLQYLSETKCEQCQYNFKKNKDLTKCEKISKSNCIEEDNFNECNLCSPGILINSEKICDKKNKCSIKNCFVCNYDFLDEENCEICNENFVLKNFIDEKGKNRFLCEKDVFGNCGFESDGSCLICDFGFYMADDGKCLKSFAYDIELFGFESFLRVLVFGAFVYF